MALGIPVSELGERMSARELAEWGAFETVFGPITVQERVDTAGALGAWASAAAAGSKAGPDKFMPQWDQEAKAQGKPTQSDDQLIAFMGGLVRKSDKRKRKQKGTTKRVSRT